jgi:hypothetical protein
MRRISSLLLLTNLSSPKDSLVNSITLSWGPPSDDKIIVLSDSNEEEVREEKSTGIKDAVVSTAVKLASTAKPRMLVRPRPAFRLHPLLLVISDC